MQDEDLLLYSPEGQLQRSWQLGGAATCLAELPRGRAVVALQGGVVLLVDLDNDSLAPLLTHSCTVRCTVCCSIHSLESSAKPQRFCCAVIAASGSYKL